MRTGEQPIYDTFVGGSRAPHKTVIPTINTLDFELLPRFDSVQVSEFRRQNDLSF